MKIIFMGTPEFAVPALQEIIMAGYDVVAVYSQPPRPKGRGQSVQNSPVHQAAARHGIPVFTPHTLKDFEAQGQFAALGADMAIVAAYGLILPKPVLAICKCINIHASLLPRWRGAAPIQRAIMAGDTRTGITIMQMDEGLDTGDMLLTGAIDITPHMTAGELHDALSMMGAKLVVEAIVAMQKGAIQGIKQCGEATYAAKILKDEARIDWNLPGEQIILNIRAFNPYPGAYFEYMGEKIKILAAEFISGIKNIDHGTIIDKELTITCNGGVVVPGLVQRQGRKVMKVEELLRGLR